MISLSSLIVIHFASSRLNATSVFDFSCQKAGMLFILIIVFLVIARF